MSPLERFWALVQKSPDPDGCWRWLGQPNHDGYGRFNDGTRRVMAHRFAYEALVAPIPDGMESDHLCKNRGCVNPAHLRATTHAENMVGRDLSSVAALNASKTHCPKGHGYTEGNTYIRPDSGGRDCLTCRSEANRRTTERRKRERAKRLEGQRCGCGSPAQMGRKDGTFTCHRCHMLKEVRPLRY